MRGVYTVGADTHCGFTELAAFSPGGRLIRQERRPTTIRDLAGFLASLRKPRVMVIEEGPLADWLVRGLSDLGETVVVCDPRRNHLVAKDSDKDDAIDAAKIGHLYQGGYIKEVHQSSSLDRWEFKLRLGLYFDGVGDCVRSANRLIAQCRRFGVFVREHQFAKEERWACVRDKLPARRIIREDLDLLWDRYVVARQHRACLRKRVVTLAREVEPIQRLTAIPGIAWIRASTFYAYIDTPFRFQKKQSLWRYMGIGLCRHNSGNGTKRLGVERRVNKNLKNMILGAALSAIASSPFKERYEQWRSDGASPRIARRNVARSIASVMWGMCKSGEVYRPDLVGVPNG